MDRTEKYAITRLPASTLTGCELTHIGRDPIDLERTLTQHEDYRKILEECNYTVITLDAEAAYPDSVFVEDTAVMLPEAAILLPLGTETRRGEAELMRETLGSLSEVRIADPEVSIEGGDVLRIGRKIFVGESSRTDADGIAELSRLTADLDYRVIPVAVQSSLHLKTAVTALDESTVLLNPDWVSESAFEGCEAIEVDPSEPFAANILKLGSRIVAHKGFPYTIGRLRNAGFEVIEADISEFLKAEAGLTCLSLLI